MSTMWKLVNRLDLGKLSLGMWSYNFVGYRLNLQLNCHVSVLLLLYITYIKFTFGELAYI